MKRLMTALLVGVSCLVLLGGCSMGQDREREQLVEIATSEEAREVYERTLKNLDKLALTPEGKIQSYDIDEESIEKNPMGGLNVTVFINNNKQMLVYNILDLDDTEELVNRSGGYSSELANLLGE